MRFCSELSRSEGAVYRLPTTDEWIYFSKMDGSKLNKIDDGIWEWVLEEYPYGSHEPYRCYCKGGFSAGTEKKLPFKWMLNKPGFKGSHVGFRIVKELK